MVTLGSLDGLSEGAVLDVYDGVKYIGQARVTKALDNLSYTELLGDKGRALPGNYYKVAIPK